MKMKKLISFIILFLLFEISFSFFNIKTLTSNVNFNGITNGIGTNKYFVEDHQQNNGVDHQSDFL